MPILKDLLDMEQADMVQEIVELGEKPFRARQLWKWLYSGTLDFDSMTDLSAGFRNRLKEIFVPTSLKIKQKQLSATDGTAKYLFELADGNLVEGVLMRYKYGLSACISTQVGCRMGCEFCASSSLGLVRNLTVGEMIGQVLLMIQDGKERIGHVVLMGIGEPFDNYNATISLLKRLNQEDALGISYRKLTVSTCGLVADIMQFADEGIPVNLSVSLHAPTQELRIQTMPIARKWNLHELLDACWIYVNRTGRRITFEYALVKGWNDSIEQASTLAKLLKGHLCHVNLIPINSIPDKPFSQSSQMQIRAFQKTLEDSGIATTIRRELGSDIDAACGQLRRVALQTEEETI